MDAKKQRNARSILALCLVLTLGSGCAYNYTFRTRKAPDEAKTVTEWKHIGLWGWIEPSPFNLEEACPGGVAEFGSYVSFTNWLCAFTTIGLYTPRTAYAVPELANVASRKE